MKLKKISIIVGIVVGIVAVPTMIIGCFKDVFSKEKAKTERPVSSTQQQGGATFGDVTANTITNSFNVGANEELVKSLTKEVEESQAKIENQKWERAAKFSNYCVFTGGVSLDSNPVYDLMNKSMDSVGSGDGRYTINCKGNVLAGLEEVTRTEPTCPYSYFHLAYCYKINNDSRWKENALTAKEIFEKTTSVPGHNSIHDSSLKNVIDMLNETK